MRRLMICIGVLIAVSTIVLVVFSILVLINCWVEDQDRLEMKIKIDEAMIRLTPPWIASDYLSRIEKASVEIQSNRKPIDQIIVLWWGVDGLRLNEDGSTEWVSRKKPEKQPEPEPFNKNVFHQPPQYMAMVQTAHPFDMRNMCQSTKAQIEELQEKLEVFKMQNATHNVNAQVVAQMQLPPLQMVYPYGYIPFPQYPYAQYYQGNLTGCCCDGSILR